MRNAQGQFGPCTNTHSLYSPLKPTVIPNPKGEFLTPMATGTNIFTEGSTMNVSWTSTFERVNLWLIVNGQYDFGGKYGGPVALARMYRIYVLANIPTLYLCADLLARGSCKYIVSMDG